MTTNPPSSAAIFDDAECVRLSLAGNREAFEKIVTQYQSLICSLTYSATGSLRESEDVAQETLLIAGPGHSGQFSLLDIPASV